MMIMELEVDSAVRGYHIYQSIWTPAIGETLICKREGGNAHDRYAVGCYKPDSNVTLVGHVPKKISKCYPRMSLYHVQKKWLHLNSTVGKT